MGVRRPLRETRDQQDDEIDSEIEAVGVGNGDRALEKAAREFGAEVGDEQRYRSPQDLNKQAYKWMDTEHSDLSKMLLELKTQINQTASHASIYLTHFTFDWEASRGDTFQGSFFDKVDLNVTRLALMSLARSIIIVVQTLRLTAEKHGGFVVRDGLDPSPHGL